MRNEIHARPRRERKPVSPRQASRKQPFNIDGALHLIRPAIRPFKKAAMFELADDGFTTPFEQLIACIISIRTFDEVTIPCARRLFELARTPAGMIKRSVKEIDEAIRPCTFHEDKARNILEIASTAVGKYGGEVPCDEEVIRSFRGV